MLFVKCGYLDDSSFGTEPFVAIFLFNPETNMATVNVDEYMVSKTLKLLGLVKTNTSNEPLLKLRENIMDFGGIHFVSSTEAKLITEEDMKLFEEI
jgi:hypothetical protein